MRQWVGVAEAEGEGHGKSWQGKMTRQVEARQLPSKQCMIRRGAPVYGALEAKVGWIDWRETTGVEMRMKTVIRLEVRQGQA